MNCCWLSEFLQHLSGGELHFIRWVNLQHYSEAYIILV